MKGRVRLFSVNRAHPLFEDLKRLLLKTEGLGRLLSEALAEIKNMEAAVIFGSFAEGKEVSSSDIDLLIIGDPDFDALNRAFGEAEAFHGRAINYVVFSEDEWRTKVQAGDSFASSILSAPIIPLLGKIDGVRGP
jgi:predicted nucleotidyltransferase